MNKFLVVACFGLTAAFTVQVNADIVYQDSVNLFQGDPLDQSFVSTNGDFVGAANGGANTLAQTVNGVTFAVNPGNDSTAQPDVSIGLFTFNSVRRNDTAFDGATELTDPSVEGLLESAFFFVDSVTLSGLVIDDEYEIQIFTNDGRTSANANSLIAFGDGNLNENLGISQANNDGNEDPDTEAGDFIIGTFTADSATLTFEVFGSNSSTPNFQLGDGRAQINAIQLRNITTAAVPEPSSLFVISLGSLLVLNRRRRR